MKKLNLIISALLLNTFILSAQTNFFKTATTNQLSKKKEVLLNIKKRRVYSLDEKAMRSYLQNAPVEFKNNGLTIPLEIPLPDGTVETFNMVESPLLSPEVAAQNPSIKTHMGTGAKDKKASISISFTSAGFNAIILNIGGETVYFDSYSNEKNNIYYNYYTKDVVLPAGDSSKSCLVESDDKEHGQEDNHRKKKDNNRLAATGATTSSSGTQLRTFRLAVAANGEFTQKYGGNTKAGGLDAVIAYVNRIRLVFRKELAVDFTLVSGENLIYTDPVTDPFANPDPTLNSVQNTIDDVLGNGNATTGKGLYDIGHLFGYVSGTGRGLAGSRVCDYNDKARAYSLIGNNNSFSQDFLDNLILHELGHQFNMSHSYNSTVNVCTSRTESTSVEPGSGITIMSYGFICGSDNPTGLTTALLQYHSVNYEQAIAFINTKTCQASTATTNIPPTVNVPAAFTIPKSTPFTLTGSATDINTNDSLTYCWEGTNIGTIVPTATTLDDTTQPPFFRSYAPSESPTRTYPALANILNGTNQDKGDKLPSIGIVTTHTLTVRDNSAAGGGVNNATVNVTIEGNTGPFLETTNLSGIQAASSTKTITWSVNGTNVATPLIKISLSIDGGFTWPTTLAASTPNDGSQDITLPNISTTLARIKIEALGNVFFDISNVNFTIEQPLNANVSGTNTLSGTSTGTATAAAFGGKLTSSPIALSSTFTVSSLNIDNTPVNYGSLTFPSLPAGATINTATLNFVNVTPTGSSWARDILASLTGAYALGYTSISSGLGSRVALATVNLPNFITTGGSINLLMYDEVPDNSGIEATFASARIDVNYTRNGYTYLWSNGATTPTINGLAAGTYSVTVTDASGATATGSYSVRTEFNVVASSDPNGTVSPAGTSRVVSGGSITYTITPNTCFAVASVLDNGASIGAVTTRTITNVTANRTISATFASSSTINTTTATTCNDYTWAHNNQVYTTSGIYTGTTANCITEQLNLTISSTTWNGTTWSNGAPNINTKAIIAGNYSQAANLTACSLDITGSAFVTVPSGFNFTISGKVAVAPTASFTLENNTNLIQLGANQNEGNTTITRYSSPLMRLDYSLWSSPVTNASQFLTTFSPSTITNRFYNYNQTTNVYNAIVNPGIIPFNLGTGYLIRVPNTHPGTPTIWAGSFTGVPNNGPISIAVVNNTYNAIGNPYPSSIDANDFIDANSLNEALYFWRKTNNALFSSYATYTKAGGTANSGGLSSIIPNGSIQVGQGFIAKSTSSSFVFDNTMRIANNDNQFLKTKAIEKDRIWLNLSKEQEPVNQMMVAYMSGATAGIDSGIDGKYFGDSSVALTSNISNEEYVIQARPLFDPNDVVALNFKTDVDGSYTITIDHFEGVFKTGQDVYLVDSKTGTETNLKTMAYTFTAKAGQDYARFSLKYQKALKIDAPTFNENSVRVYKNNNTLYVNSEFILITNVKVYDVLGRLINEKKNNKSTKVIIKDLKSADQVLIVKVTGLDKNVVTKKVLN